MSTETPTPADVAAKVTENPTTEPAASPEPAQEPDWKAEARKWESRAKENSKAAARLAEIEESQKTEAEKTAERLAALEAENAEFKKREQVAAWRAQVSEETGVPAAALAGDSLEALQAHAEVLAPLISKPQTETVEERRSVPALGKQPAGSGNVPIGEQIVAAEAAGDRALVQTLKAVQLGQVAN